MVVSANPTASFEADFGKRIRELRLRTGLSQRDLAKRCGLSNTAVSSIEKGRMSPSLGTIKRLLDGLSMTLADFFSEFSSDADSVVFREGTLPRIMRGAGVELFQIGTNLVGKQMQMLRGVYQPGCSTGPELLVHEGEEGGFIIAGTFEILVGDRTYVVSAGDAYYFSSKTPHQFKNIGSEVGVIVSSQTPPSV